MNDPISEFRDAIAAAGYKPQNGTIEADDRWHRLIYLDEKNSSGRYRLKLLDGGFAIGSYGSDKDPGGFHPWHSKATGELNREERAALREQAERSKIERAAEIDRRQAITAGRIQRAIKALPAAPAEHAYLDRKGLQTIGIQNVKYRAKTKELIVPIFQTDGKIWSIQRIQPNGWKGFFKGGRIPGGYFPLATRGDDLSTLLICEGLATGASVREATGLPVIVAFNTGNLRPVAKALKAKYPESRIVFCADNDLWTFRAGKAPAAPNKINGADPQWAEWREAGLLFNPGLEKAQQAAAEIGGAVVIWPEFTEAAGKPTDFNDLMLTSGIDAVRLRISEALNIQRAEPPADLDSPAYGGGMAEGNPSSDGYEQPPHSAPTSIWPFKILGHNDGNYYFFPRQSGQIFGSSAQGLASIANLFRLANLDFWNEHFNISGKMSTRKIAELAANALTQEAHDAGIFRPSNVRGAGAWMDTNRVVIHCGDHLYVDGEHYRPHLFGSRFVYPLRSATFPTSAEPMRGAESVKLREICGKISWESSLSGDLLAGWIVIAPFCGALDWRPHIWVEGESESGKSTVIDRIIRPLLDEVSVRFDGGTTEAAIRQEMGIDALPVIYDEAEPENLKDRMIMDGLLLLARRSSSGGRIGKGGAHGKGEVFTVRSCFCFAGINPAIKQRADESRISRLVIRRATFEGADQYYKDLKQEIRSTLTKDYGRRLIARTLANLPTLLANSEIFTDAAADVLVSRRAADQIGPMLAGLYLLTSTKRVDYETAVKWIRKHDWTQHTAIAEQSDPERLITHLCTSIVKYNGREMAVGELVSRAHHALREYEGDQHYSAFLRSIGIWVRPDGVLFANKSPPIERLLKDTAWVSWSRTLKSIEGSEYMDPLKFSTGLMSRSVLVPLSAFGIEEEA